MDLGKAEYELMFRQSPLPMWIHDLDGRFLDINQAALVKLGYTHKEILSLTLFDIRPESEWPRLKAVLAARRDPPSVPAFDPEGLWAYLRSDGTTFYMEVRASNIEVGGR